VSHREKDGAISRCHQHPSASLLKCTNLAKLVQISYFQNAKRRTSMAISMSIMTQASIGHSIFKLMTKTSSLRAIAVVLNLKGGGS
jgi:hypothetical protein